MPLIDRDIGRVVESPKNHSRARLFATLIASAIVVSLVATVLAPTTLSYIPARITYTVHDPILINDSADIASQAVNESWDGAGTLNDPYVIQGYDITGVPGSVDPIHIERVNVSFIIKDCYLHGATSFFTGIFIKNSSNGTVYNNNCSGNSWGIFTYNCRKNMTISKNTCSNNDQDGIFLALAWNHTVSNNTCKSNTVRGIHLDDSDYNVVSNNTITSGAQYGLAINTGCSHIIISDNNCSSNVGNGIYLDNGDHCTISNNTITKNGNGLVVFNDCSYITISDNNCSGSISWGMWLDNCDYSIILNNTVSNNAQHGLAVRNGCSYNTISGNNCSHNGWSGIEPYNNCNYNNITGNSVTYNDFGIYLFSDSNYNNISDNTCSNNGRYGVRLDSNNNLVWNNSLYHNYGAGDSYDPSHIQAYDIGANNRWNNSDGYGNWWSDWTTPDAVIPFGIVDNPYNIAGSGAQDLRPLTNPGVIWFIPEFPNILISMGGLMLIALILRRALRKP